MEHSDEDLIQQFKEGNRQAMDSLYSRYHTRLFNFSLRLLGNRADAEDVTSDVFLKLISGQFHFEPRAKFVTWLFTLARNRCVDILRKGRGAVSVHSNQRDGSFESLEVADNATDNSREALVKKEMAQKVQAAIQQLPLDQKEAIILREYHNFNYDQIAQILNCSLEKVKILIFRGRQNLRVSLSSLLKEDGHE